MRKKIHSVIPDIKPFVSPVDGSVISSRSQLREHNKRNNVESTGDYTQNDYVNRARDMRARMEGRTREDKRDRIEALKRAVEKNEHQRHRN